MQAFTITRLPRALAVLLIGTLALAACDESSDDDGGDPQGIDTLGGDFGDAFDQDRNDEPNDAPDLDLTPGIEPFDP